MPNWCSNVAQVQGTKEQIDSIFKAVEADDNKGFIETLIPVPEDKQDDWYAWQLGNWGCKWGDCDTQLIRQSDTHVQIEFNTAWSPPIEAYRQLEEMDFEVLAYYVEYGMMFCGRYEDGNDSCEDIVIDGIDSEADDTFEISLNLKEWAEEAPVEAE